MTSSRERERVIGSESYLRERVEHLEKVHQQALDALDHIAGLSQLKVSLRQVKSLDAVLDKAEESMQSLMPFKAVAFYLVREEDSGLSRAHVGPNGAEAEVEGVFDHLLESHFISRALHGSRPVTIDLEDAGECVLHSLSTPSRIRGLFLGLVDGQTKYVPDTSLRMVSIVCANTAHLLESVELYRLIHSINQDLEQRVADLTASKEELEREVARRLQAEQDLIRSRQMLDMVLENIPQYVFWKDRDNRYLGCNRNFLRAAGKESVEAMSGLTDHDLPWAGEWADICREKDARVMREREAVQGRLETIRMADGRERFIESNRVPLVNQEGCVMGVLGTFQDVTERKNYEERLAYQAFYDPQTGLPNRSLLMERMERALSRQQRRRDRAFCLLMLDLDRFKNVNDTLGHMAGDQLLVELAGRLAGCVREMDTVARLGGDEFAILLEDVERSDESECIASRIMEALRKPFNIQGTMQFTTGSIGIVEVRGDYRESSEILRDADIAMYHAKRQGGDAIKHFKQELQDQAVYRATLENDMQLGIRRNEFFMLYQPIHSLADGNLAGFEALLRWRHPQRGVVSPESFIPLAEKSTFIEELGHFILGEASAFAGRLRDLGGIQPYVAVNISARQLMHPEFVDRMRDTLDVYGLPADSLRLEMTETAIMERAEVAMGILLQLREMGLRLAIDDFGTGYSSFSYLQRLPVDTVKIDRFFINSIDTSREKLEIVKSIMALSTTLGLEVIAEGVETTGQLDTLRSIDCRAAQGYLFAMPLPRGEALELAKATGRSPG
ncbi:putative bifunctional diguanylate cyclase/phosphodiesterase [Desulfohalovibrio reitneri]|uniref:putative bifunctional diguanylate cyclase/phosphodiesterase n=1 Tax=Desulfohalovibrio reitneri TaxID=1307759 RepID=UPI0006906D69|nr:EAL domain-containing protein [Desulfohalovibrio reitneri]